MALCTLGRPPLQTADQHREYSLGGVVLIVTACLAVDVVGGMVTAGPNWSWNQDLTKAAWTLPEWVFGPALTVLYGLVAAAGSIVWLARDRDDVCCPLSAFAVMLTAGLGWFVLFFGIQNSLLGLVDALVLWSTAGLTVVHFFGVSRSAGWALVPYWVWSTCVAAVNASIVFTTG